MQLTATDVLVRKLATLAHWVPHLSLVIYQTDWPPLCVSREPRDAPAGETWTHVHPCQFRALLLRPQCGRRLRLGPTFGNDDAQLHIDVMAEESTTFDDAGLFTLPYDEHHCVIGFLTLASVPVPDAVVLPDAHELTCTWDVDGLPPLVSSVDEDLGTQLVSCSFPANDPRREELASATLFEAMVAAAVEEVAAVVESVAAR